VATGLIEIWKLIETRAFDKAGQETPCPLFHSRAARGIHIDNPTRQSDSLQHHRRREGDTVRPQMGAIKGRVRDVRDLSPAICLPTQRLARNWAGRQSFTVSDQVEWRPMFRSHSPSESDAGFGGADGFATEQSVDAVDHSVHNRLNDACAADHLVEFLDRQGAGLILVAGVVFHGAVPLFWSATLRGPLKLIVSVPNRRHALIAGDTQTMAPVLARIVAARHRGFMPHSTPRPCRNPPAALHDAGHGRASPDARMPGVARRRARAHHLSRRAPAR
jgi:hypothetical protein